MLAAGSNVRLAAEFRVLVGAAPYARAVRARFRPGTSRRDDPTGARVRVGMMMEEGEGESPPVAGWYPDPDGSGRERWWDGTEWGVAPPPPSSSSGPAQPVVNEEPATDRHLPGRQPDPEPEPGPLFPEPGWYDDPDGGRWDRWWDGSAWDEPLKPASPSFISFTRTGRSTNPRRTWPYVAGGLVVLFFIASAAGTSGDSGGDRDFATGDSELRHACSEFVLGHLRSPSTANFAPASDWSISGSAPTWTLDGYVDAQNAFGATIRNRFTCSVTDAGDRWRGYATLLD